MGLIINQYTDRVRYVLLHEVLGQSIVDEPQGWKDDDKEFARNTDYDGIVAKFSNSLKFSASGSDYLTQAYDAFGINAKVRLYKDQRHPQTDKWFRIYDGFLDFSTYSEENGIVSIKFNSGGLVQTLKSRYNEEIELQRSETMDGESLPDLSTVTVDLEGRPIFLQSKLVVGGLNSDGEADYDNGFDIFIAGTNGTNNEGWKSRSIPLGVGINSNQEKISSSQLSDNRFYTNMSGKEFNVNDLTTGDFDYELEGMFYISSDADRIIRLTLDSSFELDGTFRYGTFSTVNFYLTLSRYNSSYECLERIPFYELKSNSSSLNNLLPIQVEVNEVITMTLGENEFLGLDIITYRDGESRASATSRFDMIDFKGSLTVEEDSESPSSTCKAVLPHEAAERLFQTINGLNTNFYSSELGRLDIGYSKDGDSSLVALSHGFWVRNFYKDDSDEENKYQDITMSLKKFIKSYYSTRGLQLGVETLSNNSERVVIEDKRYFYNKNVLIRLGKEVNGKFEHIRVNNFKRSPATDMIYSSIEVGYNDDGSYEEATGLDEYNVKNTYTTPITAIENKLDLVSEFLAGSYPKEFARRKQREDYPTEDTDYDDDVFYHDLKRVGFNQNYKERIYSDDFQEVPEGVYRPETATNLRLSPINMLLRHGYHLNAGLSKETGGYVRYSSSTGNSSLKTFSNDRDIAYNENGNVFIPNLDKSHYLAEYYEFEYPVDFDLMQQIQGFTTKLGNKIPNFYGLVEFKDNKGNIQKGWIINVKPNGKGSWKLLKNNM